MKKRLFIYTIYIWFKTLFKITFYPFSAIREMARRPVLIPVLLSPFLSLLVIFILGRITALIITVYGFHRTFIALFLSTALISILLWQLLLIYFFVSIWIAFLRKNK